MHHYFRLIRKLHTCIQYQQLQISTTFKSWVPTNLGEILFKYIANEAYTNQKNTIIAKDSSKNQLVYIEFEPEISDLILLNAHFYGIKEAKPITFITLRQSQQNFSGSIIVGFYNKKTYSIFKNKAFQLKSEYLKKLQTVKKEQIPSEISTYIQNLLSLNQKLTTLQSKNRIKNKASFVIKSDFELQQNGLIKLTNMKIEYYTINRNDIVNLKNQFGFRRVLLCLNRFNKIFIDNGQRLNIQENVFALVLYTAIKRIVHSDTYHDTKLDTLIGVYPNNQYSHKNIAKSLAYSIKEIEFVTKRIKKEPVKGYVDSAYGIYSYLKTFKNLFGAQQGEISIIVDNAKNILKSIKALKERVDPFQKCSDVILDYLKTTLMIIAGIILVLFQLRSDLFPDVSKPALAILTIAITTAIALIFAFVRTHNCFMAPVYKMVGTEKYYIYAYSPKRLWKAIITLFIAYVLSFSFIGIGYMLLSKNKEVNKSNNITTINKNVTDSNI